jgi:hypothetical protein
MISVVMPCATWLITRPSPESSGSPTRLEYHGPEPHQIAGVDAFQGRRLAAFGRGDARDPVCAHRYVAVEHGTGPVDDPAAQSPRS